MEITLILQSPGQVKGACQTTAHHIRLGYPYCSLVARQTWPLEELGQSILTILEAGKGPQLLLPFCPLEESEEDYWQQNEQLLKEFHQLEAVISNWGLVNLPLINPKIASTHLNALSSQEVVLLQEAGVKVVALPLSLRKGELIRQLIRNSAGIDFEYQLDGQVLTGFNWYCQAEAGARPKANGSCCQEPKYFLSSLDKSLPGMQTRGNTVWLGQQMATLQQVQDLAAWGVKRGVISWGSYDLNTLQELIGLYQLVLKKGTAPLGQNSFYQQLRQRVRFHQLN